MFFIPIMSILFDIIRNIIYDKYVIGCIAFFGGKNVNHPPVKDRELAKWAAVICME